MFECSLLGPQETGLSHCVLQNYSRAGSLKGGLWLVALVYITSAIIANVWTAMGRLSKPPLKISVICDFHYTRKAGVTVMSATWQFSLQFVTDGTVCGELLTPGNFLLFFRVLKVNICSLAW